jgi:hypothetical protein
MAQSQRISPVSSGDTFIFRAQSAPFPDGVHPDKNNTVALFVSHATSERLRSAPNASVDFVVYFHGHDTLAADIIRTARLREMLVESGRKAVLVVPQLADKRSESHAGRLQRRNGLRHLLEEVLVTLKSRGTVGGDRDIGRVVLAAHSGGFQAAAFSAERGGVHVIDVYLFDALYGFSSKLLRWFRSTSRARLISYSTGMRTVEKWTKRLQAACDRAGVSYLAGRTHGSIDASEWRAERMFFLHTSVPHARVPYEFGALRDLLKSSEIGLLADR